jgi:predicted TIM-barrel fold metal-dependent hydrolase
LTFVSPRGTLATFVYELGYVASNHSFQLLSNTQYDFFWRGKMIVDANMHWLPEDLFTDEALRDSFVSCVPNSDDWYGCLKPMPGTDLQQIVLEKPQGYENLNYAENQYDIETQLRDMDAAGVNTGILRVPCWQEWLTLDMCKQVNDKLYAHINKYPGRFYALAVVPPWGTPECLAEAERCLDKLGFSGVQMAAHYGTLYLDESEFKPYFKELNRLNVPVIVHHTPLPVDYNSVLPYTNLRRQYGRCVDQATAVGRELFSGMFEEFPNLKLIHSMLGGGFFAYANMLAPRKAGGAKEELERFDSADKVRSYLDKNIFFDTSGSLQWGKAQLECAVEVLGADHILYGSSYPVRREWFAKGIDFVRGLDISDDSKALILGGNAARLFKIGG